MDQRVGVIRTAQVRWLMQCTEILIFMEARYFYGAHCPVSQAYLNRCVKRLNLFFNARMQLTEGELHKFAIISSRNLVASGGYSEEDLEEREQELRNTLDEQFGQNMMMMKESMSTQYEETQNSLKKKLEEEQRKVTFCTQYLVTGSCLPYYW